MADKTLPFKTDRFINAGMDMGQRSEGDEVGTEGEKKARIKFEGRTENKRVVINLVVDPGVNIDKEGGSRSLEKVIKEFVSLAAVIGKTRLISFDRRKPCHNPLSHIVWDRRVQVNETSLVFPSVYAVKQDPSDSYGPREDPTWVSATVESHKIVLPSPLRVEIESGGPRLLIWRIGRG